MPIAFTLAKKVPADAGINVIGSCSDRLTRTIEANGLDGGFLAGQGYTAKLGQTALFPGAPATLVVGLGPSSGLGPTAFRRAGGALARATRRYSSVAISILDAEEVPARRPAAAQALAEGVVLGSYAYTTYKSDFEPSALSSVVFIGGGGARVSAALVLGARIGEAVAFARDLVNAPGGDMTPSALAEAAMDVAERAGLEISVLDGPAIVAAGLGGLAGVNRGSAQPPRFIEITWSPPGARASLALVGKGITFDSGGLSLKSATGMATMKDDMGGAAAILGAMSVIASVAPRCKVTAYIPSTDNMTGGDATRVGDVLRIRNGKTVEVLNTDAEGRLILADALAMASEAGPDAIVDIATLTGAAVVALGSRIAGLMGSHPGWVEQVSDVADRVGERVWQLPLATEYRGELDSDVADIKNIGKPGSAGSITAGLFLKEFVAGDIPWAHLDIAGTAWSDTDDMEITKGGTGWGVRLLIELARTFHKPSRR